MIGLFDTLSELMALRSAKLNRQSLMQTMHRLATGTRINRGSDDPAGLIATMNMEATLRALEAETSANERAINIADTADAALGEISGLLNQAKTLAVANANQTGLSAEEKQANQLQIDSILSSVDRIANTTTFNGQKLLDGSGAIAASGKKLTISAVGTGHIGQVSTGGTDYTLSDLRSGRALSTTGGNVETAIKSIDAAIGQVATLRGRLGAFSKNTLQTRINQIAQARQQMIATVSMIRDVNYAMETAALARSQVLEQGSLLVLKNIRRTRNAALSLLT